MTAKRVAPTGALAELATRRALLGPYGYEFDPRTLIPFSFLIERNRMGAHIWYRKATTANDNELWELMGVIVNHGASQFIVAHAERIAGVSRIALLRHSSDVEVYDPVNGIRAYQIHPYGPSLSDLLDRGWAEEATSHTP